jgi:hypothetical protein
LNVLANTIVHPAYERLKHIQFNSICLFAFLFNSKRSIIYIKFRVQTSNYPWSEWT